MRAPSVEKWDKVTTFVGPDAGPRPPVEVLRPNVSQQVAAGLATVAALVTIASLGLSLDTQRFTPDDTVSTVSRLAWGERLGGDWPDGFDYTSPTWGAPLVVAALLLTVAAGAALVAARADLGAGWETAALLSSVVAAALLGGVASMLAAFGAYGTAVGHYAGDASGRWGPLMTALILSIALAGASAVLVRRGTPVVLATVEVTS